MKYENIIEHIYSDLYLHEWQSSLNIFLCGADTNQKKSIRNLILKKLEQDQYFNIVFPEDVFDTITANKKANLLELESWLAHSTDVIILPLEGVGAICELGAFSVNKELREKLILINRIEYKKHKSFINDGPIDLILKERNESLIFKRKEQVIYWPKSSKEQNDKIESLIKLLKGSRFRKNRQLFCTPDKLIHMFDFCRFLSFVIAFFQPCSEPQLEELILPFCVKKEIDIDLAKLLNPCLRHLLKKGSIKRTVSNKSFEKMYYLSSNTHNYICNIFLDWLSARNKHVKNKYVKNKCNILNNKYSRSKFKELCYIFR